MTPSIPRYAAQLHTSIVNRLREQGAEHSARIKGGSFDNIAYICQDGECFGAEKNEVLFLAGNPIPTQVSEEMYDLMLIMQEVYQPDFDHEVDEAQIMLTADSGEMEMTRIKYHLVTTELLTDVVHPEEYETLDPKKLAKVYDILGKAGIQCAGCAYTGKGGEGGTFSRVYTDRDLSGIEFSAEPEFSLYAKVDTGESYNLTENLSAALEGAGESMDLMDEVLCKIIVDLHNDYSNGLGGGGFVVINAQTRSVTHAMYRRAVVGDEDFLQFSYEGSVRATAERPKP